MLHPGATVIAFYNNGHVLAAEMEIPNKVADGRKGLVLSLNLFLPNTGGYGLNWQPGNDFAQLITNSCRYALKHASL